MLREQERKEASNAILVAQAARSAHEKTLRYGKRRAMHMLASVSAVLHYVVATRLSIVNVTLTARKMHCQLEL